MRLFMSAALPPLQLRIGRPMEVTLEAKFSKHAFVEFGAAEAGAGGTDVDLLSD